MALSISGLNSLAGTLSTAPDWKKAQSLQSNLSGEILEFTIPGRFSVDFPSEFPANKNVYDPDHYIKRPSFKLAEFYWDYKDRSFLFWQDILGTLKMRINIHKAPTAPKDDIFQQSQFISMLDKVTRNMHDIPDDKSSTESGLKLPETYEPISLKSGTIAIRYTIEGGITQSDYIAYAIPLNESHFILAIFTIMVARDENYKDWYNTCLNDIDKIMDSFKLSHPGK
jgi:hypothetical protein